VKPYTHEREETHHQVVIRRDTDGDGQADVTEVWEKNSAGSTTAEGHSRIVNGERYDHYGKHIGPAGSKK
jgi:hypothetical protein